MRRCWADKQWATEMGAYGVAILLITKNTEFTAVERSRKGTGFDYWLGPKADGGELPFQRKARLEVSGILKGGQERIASRVKQKAKQTERSDGALPAFVAVVHFGIPSADVTKR